jgi:branched-chain amino acid transport system substrate-binding protein
MRRRGVGVSVVAAMVLAATTVVGVTGADAADGRPGVSATEIRVGGIASPPSAVSIPFEDAFEGTMAYFDMVNAHGGVFGRALRLVAQLSDQGSPSGNVRAAQTLVQEKKVFAVLPVSTGSFSGGRYLAEKGVPTFGFDIDAGFCGTSSEEQAIEAALPARHVKCPRKNIFGEKGSFLCFTCPILPPAYVAKEMGYTRVAIVAYGSFAQAVDCASGVEASLKKYGLDIVFDDRSLPYNFSDASNDVQEMKDRKVQFVASCMDFSGTFKISQQLRQSGADDIAIFAPEGYRRATIQKYGTQLDRWFFGLEFTPWEAKDKPLGTRQYLSAMKRRGLSPSEQSQAGWINAALLVEGLKRAGPHFTQASVVDAINAVTDFTADGILTPIDWSIDGHGPESEQCNAYVEVRKGKAVPRFGRPGQPFTCFPNNPAPATFDAPYFRPLAPGEVDPVHPAP